MHPRFSKVLGPNVRNMLVSVMQADSYRLNDNVSNLAHALIDYDEWALHFHKAEIDLHIGMGKRNELMGDIILNLQTLHNSLSLPLDPIDALQADAIIDYAVGFVAIYFWA